MSRIDDFVALQLLADDVKKARRKAEKLLALYADLCHRVNELNGDDPGAGSPTRMDGILRVSNLPELANELVDIAETICRELDMDTPSSARAMTLFFNRLYEAGVPLDILFDALDGGGRDSPGIR